MGTAPDSGDRQQGADSLDIGWIESLPAHLKSSIDEAFADGVRDQTVTKQKATDPGLKTIDREATQQLRQAHAEAVTRLADAQPTTVRKRGKDLEIALTQDPEYTARKARIESDRLQQRAQREAELTAAADGPMFAGSRADSVVNPPTATVTRLEGKALARTNFMSWAIDVLGSSERAKQHYLSIRQVTKQPGMYLTAAAAQRFEAARASFEATHPGYTLPSTDIAQALRGFHQARQGIGMLGHALGVAFDLMAFDNPNQKLGDIAHYGYLLDRMDGRGGQRGRSVMTLGTGGEAAIAQAGRNTVAGKPSTGDDAVIANVRDQFNEMVTTSEQVRASMSAHLGELSAARDDYFNSHDTEKDLAQASLDVKNGDAVAAKILKNEKLDGDAAARAARLGEIKRDLAEKKQRLSDDLKEHKAVVQDALQHAFADWIATINTDLAAAQTRKAQSDAEISAQAAARAALNAIDPKTAGAVSQLDAFADQYNLKKPRQKLGTTAYKAMLQSELRIAQKPRAKTDPMSPEYIQAELVELNGWIAKLQDPARVFGKGHVVSQPEGTAPATKHWATNMEVSNAPIMQFIEHGFIRHDEMPDRAGQQDTKEVFNVEVATTLARFGFSPGATFRDTMHFDFIDGYSASPGGRSMVNMQHNKYGPSGDVPALKGRE